MLLQQHRASADCRNDHVRRDTRHCAGGRHLCQHKMLNSFEHRAKSWALILE